MFIARRNPHLRRRSEERESAAHVELTVFPLLRTALGG